MGIINGFFKAVAFTLFTVPVNADTPHLEKDRNNPLINSAYLSFHEMYNFSYILSATQAILVINEGTDLSEDEALEAYNDLRDSGHYASLLHNATFDAARDNLNLLVGHEEDHYMVICNKTRPEIVNLLASQINAIFGKNPYRDEDLRQIFSDLINNPNAGLYLYTMGMARSADGMDPNLAACNQRDILAFKN